MRNAATADGNGRIPPQHVDQDRRGPNPGSGDHWLAGGGIVSGAQFGDPGGVRGGAEDVADLVGFSFAVRDEAGAQIPGLYAVGEVIGAGATCGNSFCSGMLVTPALTFGRLLGERLAQQGA
ncbi:hypothetical protein [Melissospora conviva]|jgi:hypothetical protein|uniref:hypothetical protein n=1 Tax=Melissospora conviva TaxID=3388432 RepID=UPI003B81DB03